MTWNDLECPTELNVRMSHGLLADSVDTSLANLLYTVGHKKRATFIFTITLANVDQFQ